MSQTSMLFVMKKGLNVWQVQKKEASPVSKLRRQAKSARRSEGFGSAKIENQSLPIKLL